MKKRLLALLFVLCILSVFAHGQQPYSSEIYKQCGDSKLELRVYKPEVTTVSEKGAPAVVFFFGGGWLNGNIGQFAKHAEYLSGRGMTVVLVQYRTESSHKATPYDCIADAKSAMRYVRANAKRLGIDATRIAAGGGSAGGHLAAATAFVTEFDAPDDNLKVSPVPNALILYNPVVDNSPQGYGNERIGDRWQQFSPLHNIGKNAPPTIFFLGSKDNLIPVATAEKFKKRIEEKGGRCDLFVYEGQKHGFFNYSQTKPEYFNKTLLETDKFLVSLGYLSGKPTITDL